MPFPHLLSPIQIGSLTVPNRVLITAHTTNFSDKGIPTARDADYYEERARGGAGMIVIGAIRVHPTTLNSPFNIRGFDPAVVPAYQNISDAIHKHGAVVIGQLLHMGRQTTPEFSRLPLWAPSAIPCPLNKVMPHAMTTAEIDEVIAHFAQSAIYAKQGGMDGVEIHGAHGYLIQQFMSPWSNHRSDAYGGSQKNRLRFAFQVMQAVRDAVGREFVVGFRLSAEEFTEGGLDLQQMMHIAGLLEASSQLDFLSVSQSNYNPSSFQTMIPDMYFDKAPYTYLAAAIKDSTNTIPIFTVARILEPQQGEEIIAAGGADMVGMTRAHIADPELMLKARENRLDDIRLCIGCNQGCAHMIHMRQPMTCLQNPTVGHESRRGVRSYQQKTPQPRRVMVIGGGPAGMEAAIVAARRGHVVSLYEKSERLGGQVNLLTLVPERGEFFDVVRWRQHMLEKLKVEVQLKTTVTPELVAAQSPDVVVLATGSTPTLEAVPGLDASRHFSAEDALQSPDTLGDGILLVDKDGHYRAAATAEFLAGMGKKVTVITPHSDVGIDIPKINFVGVRERFAKLRIRVLPYTKLDEIKGTSAHLTQAGFPTTIEGIDGVVLVLPRRANDDLYRLLVDLVPSLHPIGDCLAPRRALEAIWEGHEIGWTI